MNYLSVTNRDSKARYDSEVAKIWSTLVYTLCEGFPLLSDMLSEQGCNNFLKLSKEFIFTWIILLSFSKTGKSKSG